MISEILTNNHLQIKKRMKNMLFYVSRKKGAKRAWKNRHQKVFDLYDQYTKSCTTTIEYEHQKKWSEFRNRVDLSTLRICKNISGQADPRIVPEDIFVSDIEPTLRTDESVHFLSNKSFYNRWFPEGIFPKDIFHCVNGQYLDSDLQAISFSELKDLAQDISYPLVIKPNWNSYGGKDVFFVENSEKLINLCEKSSHFVVQKKIKQHEFFRKYNSKGINTVRVYVYKSVKDDCHYILNMALRMGKEGSLDNVASGGIHTMINQDGFLNNYAVDKYGARYTKHPDTGCPFDEKIPAYEELKMLALKISRQVYFTRILGLDMCYDYDGNWRVIEINTKGHTIRFSQYGGQPFFGDFTDEVIEYCKQNHWALN